MKVIAKTEGGFLVQATETELANAAGFHAYSAPWRGDRSELKLGTIIKVSDNYAYFESIREAGKTVNAKADQLRKLADLIDSGIPTIVVVPKEID